MIFNSYTPLNQLLNLQDKVNEVSEKESENASTLFFASFYGLFKSKLFSKYPQNAAQKEKEHNIQEISLRQFEKRVERHFIKN